MRIDLIRESAPFVTTVLENLFDRDRDSLVWCRGTNGLMRVHAFWWGMENVSRRYIVRIKYGYVFLEIRELCTFIHG